MTARKALTAAGVLAACLATRAQPAHAQQPPVRLQWSAPSGCPDQAQVLERVRAYLKLDRWPATLAVSVDARARVRGPRGRLSLQLEVDSGAERSVRTLEDADCNVLANGAALLIALALAPALESQAAGTDPAAADGALDLSGTSEPSSAPAPAAGAEPKAAASARPAAEPNDQEEPLPTPTPTPTRAPAVARPPASPPIRITDNAVIAGSGRDRDAGAEPRAALGGGLTLYADLAPGEPSVGIEAAAELWLQPWRFGLGLGFVPFHSGRSDRYPAVELQTGADMLTVWPCYDLLLTDLALGLCADGELGLVFAQLRGIDDPAIERSFWAAGGGGLSLRLQFLPHVAATLELRVLRAVNDLHFVIGTPGGEAELHRTGPISVRLALRIAWNR